MCKYADEKKYYAHLIVVDLILQSAHLKFAHQFNNSLTQ